jgi:hypothetical protein
VLAALIIVFREVFEAGLIIGIVLAVTGSIPHRNRWIGGGVLAGRMRRSRAPSNWPGPFFATRSWAGCTTNMFGFDLRQAQVAH